MKHPIKIAITGKIGSGKTFVSKFLKELGYKVFESDEEVAKIFGDLKFKKKIECLFSKKISKLFMKNGLVNRKALGDYVFSRKIELEKLENIIYPILKKKKKEFISLFMEEKILFFDIPLLFQKKLHREFNYIILLWLERKLQLKRVLKRKGMSQEKFDKIFKMQKYDQDEYEKFISLKINTSKDISFVKKELKNFVDEIN